IGMGAIFSYGFKIADENFKAAECQLFTLTNYPTLIKEALKTNYINNEAIASLEQWRNAPSTWKK
ncbi:MAG: orotate phosphoribosyltransferase, partial [Parvicellaceae bacterium]